MFGDTPAKGSGDLKSALAGEYSQRRGPPRFAFVAEAVIIPILGETDQEYICRVARERYTLVEGETPEEAEMVNFYKQVIAASSRGIISSFVMSVMIYRHWGKDRKDTDTSLMTVAQTYKQLHAWMHPDHFSVFCWRSKDHHDLIHNGVLALTQAAATLKTKLKSGELVRYHWRATIPERAEGVPPLFHRGILSPRFGVPLRSRRVRPRRSTSGLLMCFQKHHL